VAEVVKAYYDAGKRPASHLAPPPEPMDTQVPDEAAVVSPEPEVSFEPEPSFEQEPGFEPELSFEPEPASAAVTGYAGTAAAEPRYEGAAAPEPAYEPTPVHKSLAELAEELEAFIEVIRYGDDLGSSTART
jgi:hypothetical protein